MPIIPHVHTGLLKIFY